LSNQAKSGGRGLIDLVHPYTYPPCHLHVRTHFWTSKAATLRPNLNDQGVRAVQEVGAAIGEDGSLVALGKEAGGETETGIDDARISEMGEVDSGLMDGWPSVELKMMAVGKEGVVGSARKKAEVHNCSPVARIQEVATLKGMAGEDQ